MRDASVGAAHAVDEGRHGYRRIERSYGSFTRSFLLPKAVNPEPLHAGMADGILTITIPKPPQMQPKRIEIKPGNSGGRQLTS